MGNTAKTQCFAKEGDVLVVNGGRTAAKDPGDMLSEAVPADEGDLMAKSSTGWASKAVGDAVNEATALGFFGLAALVGQQAYPGAALKEDYASGDLDTEAEVIAALNATNAMLNKLRTALINLGLVASS